MTRPRAYRPSPAEAGKRAYGADINNAQNQQVELDVFYAPFNQQVAAARDVIKDAVANRGEKPRGAGAAGHSAGECQSPHQ